MAAPGYRSVLPETEDEPPELPGAPEGSGDRGARGAAGRREPPNAYNGRERQALPFEIDAWEPSLLRKLLGADNTPDDTNSDEN